MTNDAECEYDPQPAVGQRLRALRLRRGLSQTALAGDRVSPSAISLLESGHRQPTQRTLAYLAEQLGCTVEFLRDGVETTTVITLKLALARTELALLVGEADAARSELSAVAGEDLARFPGAWEQVTLLEALVAELSGDPETAVRLLENLTAAMPPAWRTDAASREVTGSEPSPGSGPAAGEESTFPCAPSAVYTALARCQRALGRPDAAGRAARQGLALLSSLDLADSCYSAELSTELLQALDTLNAPAAEDVARATLSQAAPDAGERLRGHLSAATLAREQGLVAEALRIVDTARSAALSGREKLRGAQARATAALFLYGRGEARPEVLGALRECRTALGDLGDPVTSGRCAAALAHVALEDGDLAGARELAETSLSSLAGSAATLTEARTRLVLGTILAEDEDTAGAQREAAAAASLLRTVPDGRETADAWRQTGELMQRTGNAEGALEALRRALGAVGIGARDGELRDSNPAREATNSDKLDRMEPQRTDKH